MYFENWLVRFLNNFNRRRSADGSKDEVLLGRSGGPSPTTVHFSRSRRPEHMVVLGKTGMGKTHFLEHLARQLMERGEGFLFFDFHGDAFLHLLGLASDLPGADERVVVIDPSDPYTSPGLNPLELSDDSSDVAPFLRASTLTTILKQRWQMDSFGARTEELLRNTLYTLAVNHLTLTEVPPFLTSAPFRHRLTNAVTHVEVREYWDLRYEPLSEAMKAVFREPLLNKVTAFLAHPAARHLLGQVRSTVQFETAMQQGGWILVNLAKGHLGEEAHTLGNLIFARLQFEVLARAGLPEGRRRLFTVICDEVQNLAENDLVTLLAEGRKFAVSLATANQFWEQLPRELRGALLSAGTHVFFSMSASDATTLAPELSVTARQKYIRELTSLGRGEAIVRVGPTPPLHIRVPRLPPHKKTGVISRDELRSLSAARYSRRRGDVEEEIRTRRSSPTLTQEQRALTHDEDGPPEGQHDW